MAYAREHSSKPQTLANALNDSPAGLAAWILEKFHRWTDCHGDLDSVYDRDDLLTNLTIYWATRTIGSSMRLYYETAHSTTAGYGRVEIPTGMAMSSAGMFPTPREWVERQYNVTHWTDLPRGGHFLEWEVPTSSPMIYIASSTPTDTTQEASTSNPAHPSQLRRPTTVSHQMLIDPAKTRRAVHRMKERVAADAASTAGRLATRFQYVTRIEEFCGARVSGIGVGPSREQCIVINDFALALLA